MRRNQYKPQIYFHPGETLDEKLGEMGLKPEDFAEFIDRPLKTINDVINGKTAITQDLAVQLETATKIPTHFWLNSQRNYDEFIARKYKKAVKEAVLI